MSLFFKTREKKVIAAYEVDEMLLVAALQYVNENIQCKVINIIINNYLFHDLWV